MEKINAIKAFLKKQNITDLVLLHNDWCEKNKYFELTLFPLETEHINYFFGTAGHLFLAMKNSRHFNIESKWFRLSQGEIRTDIEIDFDALAEHLVRWGDSKFYLDMTEHLESAFIDMVVREYINGVREGNFSREDIEKELSTMGNDYLMEDWNYLSRELWECLVSHS